jgi:hypothetical protein
MSSSSLPLTGAGQNLSPYPTRIKALPSVITDYFLVGGLKSNISLKFIRTAYKNVVVPHRKLTEFPFIKSLLSGSREYSQRVLMSPLQYPSVNWKHH